MAIIQLTTETQVRGLQQIAREQFGPDTESVLMIVKHSKASVFSVEVWNTDELGSLPTLAEMTTAAAREDIPPESDEREVWAEIDAIKKRLDAGGL